MIQCLEHNWLIQLAAERSLIPAAFLHALAHGESNCDSNMLDKRSGARGLFAVVDVVREDFNHRRHAAIEPEDLFLDTVNTEIAVDLLTRIINLYKNKNGISVDWNNDYHVGLVVAGYNAGYVGVSKILAQHQINSLEDLQRVAAEMPYAWARFLALPERLQYWKRVVAMYARRSQRPPLASPSTSLRQGAMLGGFVLLMWWVFR